MWNPGMILSVLEYPGIPCIHFKGGILNVESWDDTECVRVSQDSPDTFQRGILCVESQDDIECVRVSQESTECVRVSQERCIQLGRDTCMTIPGSYQTI